MRKISNANHSFYSEILNTALFSNSLQHEE